MSLRLTGELEQRQAWDSQYASSSEKKIHNTNTIYASLLL